MICLMDLFFTPNCQNFLLLSKDSMKKSNAKIDFTNYKVSFLVRM